MPGSVLKGLLTRIFTEYRLTRTMAPYLVIIKAQHLLLCYPSPVVALLRRTQ
jgi:hypothetical protein